MAAKQNDLPVIQHSDIGKQYYQPVCYYIQSYNNSLDSMSLLLRS